MAWNEAAASWMRDAFQHGFGAMLGPVPTSGSLFTVTSARYQSICEISWQVALSEELDEIEDVCLKVGTANWQSIPLVGRLTFAMPAHDVTIHLRCGPNVLAQSRVALQIVQPTVALFLACASNNEGCAEVELYARDAHIVQLRLNGVLSACESRALVRIPVSASSQQLEAIVLGVANTRARTRTSLVIPGRALPNLRFEDSLLAAIRARA